METRAESKESTGRKEGLLLHTGLEEDLIIFKWLEKQITNKKSITACLLVLQGIACSEEPPGADPAGVRQK